MKKIAFFVLFVFASTIVLAQENKETKLSYYHSVDVKTFLECRQSIGWGAGIEEFHGVQFNQHLVLGLGIGFNYLNTRSNAIYQDFDLIIPESSVNDYMFKTYLQLRYLILDNKWSPLIAIGAGYLGMYTSFPERNYATWLHGFSTSFLVGCNYKYNSRNNYYMGVGFEAPQMICTFNIGFKF